MIEFIKHWKIYLFISTTVIVSGLLSIFFWGYRYSIDFVGGTDLRYEVSGKVNQEQIRQIAEEQAIEIQEVAISRNVLSLRTDALEKEEEVAFQNALEAEIGALTVVESQTVGPTIGEETIRKTAIASAIAIVGILLYVAYAFRNLKFAVAAITALLHDGLVVLGTYSLLSYFFGAELDTLFVTALLTTMSFSVHDTIVVFDQIREYQKRGHGDITIVADQALTDTMARSLNNSLTIMFMLLALVLLGGSTIRYFAVALLIGTITGTYSSPFVATPVAVWLSKLKVKS